MKSNNALIGTALLFLVMAVSSSVTLWGSVSSPVKIAMFGFISVHQQADGLQKRI